MFRLALRNIVRQRAHSAMTLVAIVFGVAGLILTGGWVNDIFDQLGEALIHSHSGHLQVYRQGFYEYGSRSPEKYLIDDSEGLKRRIESEKEVASVMARLYFSGLLNNGRSDVPIVGEGVEASREAALGTSLRIVEGTNLQDKDAFGVVIGRGVAQALKLKPGAHVTLLANSLEGALSTLDVEVVGIFQSFSNDYDARAVRVLLPAAQELLGKPSANALVIALHRTPDTDAMATALRAQLGPAGLEVKTWIELNDFYEKVVTLYRRQFGVLQFIVLVMVVLGVANSVNMSVLERVGEFGTMRALGDRKSQVYRLVLCESALLGTIGGALGVLAGAGLALAISAVGIPMPPPPNADIGYTARIQLVPAAVFMAFAAGVVATVLAALWPAARVSRTPVIDALRANI